MKNDDDPDRWIAERFWGIELLLLIVLLFLFVDTILLLVILLN